MKLSFDRLITRGLKTWERQSVNPWVLAIAWILMVGLLAFFWRLGSTGLLDETEPLFVEASRQMTLTGDWITPYFNGVTRFDKPPLIYWLQASSFLIFGVNEFAARLPSALAGYLLAGFCFYTLRYFGTYDSINSEKPSHSPSQWQGWLVASLGAAMVALNPLTLFFGRTGYSDMVLSLCFGGSLLAFFMGYAQTEQRKVQQGWYLGFIILSALAVLTKGPVGIVLPGLIIAAFLVYVGRLREVLGEMRLVRGILIFLAISVPWFILVTLQNGEVYINSFFGVHNFERFTSVVNEHSGPWYYQIVLAFIGFAPWSLALPAAIAHTQPLQRQRWQQAPRSTQLGLFALFWFVIVLGFFTIAVTKYFSYTLPLMPAAAILVAIWWSRQIVQGQIFDQTNRGTILTSLLSIIFFIALAIASYYCPQWLDDDPSMPELGLRLSEAGLNQIGAVIWGVSAIAGIILLLCRQAYRFWAVSCLGFVAFTLFVIIPALGIVDLERQLPLRQVAESAVQVAAPGEQLVMVTDEFEKPSLVFYAKRNITFLDDTSKAISNLRKIEEQSQSDSLLVIARHKALEETGLKPNQYQQISQAGIYQLIRVPKAGIL
jgi:4-amino-4-deoxy-L-arabinose transferase-like glycosyltransferase